MMSDKSPEKSLLRKDWSDEEGLSDRDVDEAIDAPDADSFQVVRWAMRGGVRLLRQEPTLVLWQLLGGVLRGLFGLAPWAVLLFALAARAGTLKSGSDLAILTWLIETAEWLFSPKIIVGMVGLFLVTSVASWCLDIAFTSGVLGSLRRRLLAGDVAIEKGLFLKTLGERFGELLGWSLLRGLTLGASALLLGGMLWAGYDLLIGWSVGDLGLAAALGALGMLGGAVLLVVFVVYELALAELILQQKSLGEAIFDSAQRLGGRIGEVAWLFLTVALIYGVLWAVYTPFYLVASYMGGDSQLATAGLVLQLLIDLVLAVVMVTAAIWFRGAVLAYLGIREGRVKRLPPRPTRSRDKDKTTDESGARLEPPTITAPERMERPVPPEELLPDRTPHIVTLSEVRSAFQRDDQPEE